MEELRARCKCRPRTRGWLVVVGGVLVHLSLGTFYTFGNMNPYITSYIRGRSSPSDLTSGSTTWIMAVQMSTLCCLMSLGGVLQRKLGTTVTTLLGCLLMSCSVLVTYFAIQSSFGVVLFTYGFLFSLGEAIAYTPPLFCAVKWHPDRKGLVSGLILAGYGGGAFFFNQIQTAFVNPGNLKVDPQDGYFNQPELLDRVPSSFLLVGGICASLQLLGIFLVRDPPGKDQEPLISDQSWAYGSGMSIDSDGNLEDSSQTASKEALQKPIEYQENSTKDYSPCEVLKEKSFYILIGIDSCVLQALFFVQSLYKVYGETFINDDRFLALIGSFSAVANAMGRIIWGLIMDKTSFKTTAIICSGSCVALAMTLIACPLGGKPMFFLWVCLLNFTFAAFTSNMTAVCAKAFGTKHAAINYGLLLVVPGISSLFPALLASELSSIIGWVGIFSLTGGFFFIALCLSFAFNVKNQYGQDV